MKDNSANYLEMLPALLVSAASFLGPLPVQQGPVVTQRRASAPVASVERRGVLAGFAAAALAATPAAFAATDSPYSLKKDYVVDAKNMLENMKTATELQRGNPEMARRGGHTSGRDGGRR